MAAFMASTYKCYLGEGWSKWVESLRIPHPGRVIGRLVMMMTMPLVLDWVLGGNTDHVAPNRKVRPAPGPAGVARVLASVRG
jgi:zeaxanthin epoxidase